MLFLCTIFLLVIKYFSNYSQIYLILVILTWQDESFLQCSSITIAALLILVQNSALLKQGLHTTENVNLR